MKNMNKILLKSMLGTSLFLGAGCDSAVDESHLGTPLLSLSGEVKNGLDSTPDDLNVTLMLFAPINDDPYHDAETWDERQAVIDAQDVGFKFSTTEIEGDFPASFKLDVYEFPSGFGTPINYSEDEVEDIIEGLNIQDDELLELQEAIRSNRRIQYAEGIVMAHTDRFEPEACQSYLAGLNQFTYDVTVAQERDGLDCNDYVLNENGEFVPDEEPVEGCPVAPDSTLCGLKTFDDEVMGLVNDTIVAFMTVGGDLYTFAYEVPADEQMEQYNREIETYRSCVEDVEELYWQEGISAEDIDEALEACDDTYPNDDFLQGEVNSDFDSISLSLELSEEVFGERLSFLQNRWDS